MNAQKLLLTHFSNRYPKIPNLADSAKDSPTGSTLEIAIAFDYLNLRLGDFWKMRSYNSAFDALFASTESEEPEV